MTVILISFLLLLLLIIFLFTRTYISFKDVVHRLHKNNFYIEIPISHTNDNEQAQLGSDIHMNKDGSRFIVSSSQASVDQNQNVGLTQVFQYNKRLNKMQKLGQDLFGTASGDTFGQSVSMNDKGDIIAISAPYYGTNAGQVRVYKYISSNNIWSQLGVDINGSGNDIFGDSISLSSDGLTLAVSFRVAPSMYNVAVYKYENENWTLYGNTISVSQDIFDIKLTSQGNRLIVLNPSNQNVLVYEYQTDSWVNIANIMTPSGFIFFHLAISDEAELIAVGSSDGNGKVVIYKHDYNGSQHTWTVHTQLDGIIQDNKFGQSVSIGGDNIVINDCEHMYIYKKQNEMFVLTQTVKHESHTLLSNMSIIDKNGKNIIYSNRYGHGNHGICKAYRPLNEIFSTLL